MNFGEPITPQVASQWLASVDNAHVAAELQALFAEAHDAIVARGPACWASGRCCNFAKAGHRLYVTGLEAAWTVVHAKQRASAPALQRDEKKGSARLALPQVPQLSQQSIAQALERGDCPFLVANACSVHEIKPLACRVYFCDQSAQDWQHTLSESLQTKLKGLHEAHGIPYSYAEWRTLLKVLEEVADSGGASAQA